MRFEYLTGRGERGVVRVREAIQGEMLFVSNWLVSEPVLFSRSLCRMPVDVKLRLEHMKDLLKQTFVGTDGVIYVLTGV
jgi:hypothetical protein